MLHEHPLFFTTTAEGLIQELIYHPDDIKGETRALRIKQFFLSPLQVVRPTAVRRSMQEQRRMQGRSRTVIEWEADEATLHGYGRSHYTARPGLFGRQVLQKTTRWQTGVGVEAVNMSSLDTIILDENSDAIRSVTSKVTYQPIHSENAALDVEMERQFIKVDNVEIMPTEPVVLSWNQIASAEPTYKGHSQRSLRAREDNVTFGELLQLHGFQRTAMRERTTRGNREGRRWEKADLDSGFSCLSCAAF
jgi:hypothetical protein